MLKLENSIDLKKLENSFFVKKEDESRLDMFS
jgi:hypothetical protein